METTSSLALDVFYVRDRYGKVITDQARWVRVQDLLVSVLSGAVSVASLFEEPRTGRLPPPHQPAVLTEIEIDNQVSSDFTVIDVYAQDRPGLLHAVTRTLAELGLDIHLSKIATEVNRVADVFYVRDGRLGGKIIDATRQQEIRIALERALS
jgi:[protein-PII] uridylyltransferase